jgi:hypothetical protein
VFYNLKSGRSKLLSLETYIQLSIGLGITVDELLGLEDRSVTRGSEFNLVVRSKAQQGLQQSAPDLPLNMQYQVALPVAPEFRAEGAYGVEFRANIEVASSSERTILVVIPFRPSRSSLRAGQSVIIHTRQQAGVEITVATVVMTSIGLAVQLQKPAMEINEIENYQIKIDGRFESPKARAFTVEATVIGKWQTLAP